jgi:hypothetical protein
MKCPHCRVEFYDNPESYVLGEDANGYWKMVSRKCPACNKFILHLVNGQLFQRLLNTGTQYPDVTEDYVVMVKPRTSSRPPCPAEVPNSIAEDYVEACLVLSDSPKASAALSRRCLQHVLRDAAKVRHGDLANEIQQILDSKSVPSYIADAIDAIRNVGNFAAHPLKSQSTGEIIPVEPEEAEWNLDVLETLFDFYYVQPALLQRKRDSLNRKLQEAGKKPMK